LDAQDMAEMALQAIPEIEELAQAETSGCAACRISV